MIKQVLHIALALLLLISTGGVFLNQHYCHNNRTEITINHVPDNCCGNTCNNCHNESIYLKVADAFTMPNQLINIVQYLEQNLFAAIFFAPVDQSLVATFYTFNTAPPTIGLIPIFKVIQNFRL